MHVGYVLWAVYNECVICSKIGGGGRGGTDDSIPEFMEEDIKTAPPSDPFDHHIVG